MRLKYKKAVVITLVTGILVLGSLVTLAIGLAGPETAREGNGSYMLAIPFMPKGYQGGVGNVIGKVVDARDATPLDGVQVCYFDIICTFTNTNGDYSFGNVPSGLRWFRASASNYADFTKSAEVFTNQTIVVNFALSPDDLESEGQYRIIVTWNEQPPDLDAHLYTPDFINGKKHIFQGNPANCGAPGISACLDIDDIDGLGPETITILEAQNGIYHYAVQKFEPACPDPNNPGGFIECPTQLQNSGASVQVYDYTGLRDDFEVPPSNPNNYKFWYVFSLEFGSLGEVGLTVENCYADQPPSEDTPPTCP